MLFTLKNITVVYNLKIQEYIKLGNKNVINNIYIYIYIYIYIVDSLHSIYYNKNLLILILV